MAKIDRRLRSYRENLERYYWELKARGDAGLPIEPSDDPYERELFSIFVDSQSDRERRVIGATRDVCH